MKLRYIASCLFILLVLAVMSVDATVSVTNENYERMAEILHSFPHFSFWDYNEDVTFSTKQSYIESLAILASPFAAASILLLGIGFLFCCCRCFGGCGGRKDGYTSCERGITQLFLILVILATFLFCGGGIWGSVHFHQTLPSVLDRAEDTGDLLLNRALKVQVDIVPLKQYINSSEEIDPLINDAKKMRSKISDNRNNIDTAEMTRNIADISVLGVIVFIGLVGLFAAAFSWGLPTYALVVLLWIVLLYLWPVTGVHLSASVAVGDICETVDEFLQQDFFSSNESTQIVHYYLFCNTASPFPSLESEIVDLIQYANSSLEKAKKENNQTAIAYWTTVLAQSEQLQTDFDILVDCQTTASKYNDTKKDVCTDILVSTVVTTGCQIVVCILSIALLILGVLGYDRFSRPEGYIELGDEFNLAEKERRLYPDLNTINLH